MNLTHDNDGLQLVAELEDDEEANLREILEIGLKGCRECFYRQRSPAGQPWARLAASTVKARQAKGQPGQAIGMVSGSMLDGLSRGDFHVTERQGVWSYPPSEPDHSKAHSFHNGNPDRRQPARPFIGWTDSARQEVRSRTKRP